jgi:ABC-2 type transport system ATP-binding protein
MAEERLNESVMASIKLVNVYKRFGKKLVLDNISFEPSRNGAIGYLGPNGAGKTTTFKVLLGLLKPTSGAAYINGIDVRKDRKNALLNVGSIVESPEGQPGQTVREAIEMAGAYKGLNKQQVAAQIENYESSLKLPDLSFKINELSKGLKQRVSLMMALIAEPNVLILDEPTEGLDPAERIRFMQLINSIKKDRLILISSHIIPEIREVCDSIILINNGKIIDSGTITELQRKYGSLEKMYMKMVG